MHIALRFTVSDTRLLKLLDYVQRNAHGFIAMMRVRSENQRARLRLRIRGLM